MNPIGNLISRLDAKRSGKGWIAKCPAHDDRKPSLSINEGADGRALIKCHAGCDNTAILASLGMMPRDLFLVTSHRQSDNGATSTAPFDWSKCVAAFTDKHIERLAGWRGYSIEFCYWLKQNGFLGLYDGCIAFPVQDRSGNVVAAHYRLKDGSWRYLAQGAKVHPLVIGELAPGEPVYVFESQWDCFAFLEVSGERTGVISVEKAYAGLIFCLLDTYRLVPERFTLASTSEALRALNDHHDAIVKRRHGELRDVSSYAARWNEQAWRIAVCLHAGTHGGQAHEQPLSFETAQRAIALADWFAEEQLRILNAGRIERKTARLKKLKELIIECYNGAATLRDLDKSNNFKQDEVLELTSRFPDILVIEKRVTGGRPSEIVRITKK